MFSSIRSKCIHCRGDHAPGSCPTKTRPQATQNAAGYQTYNNSAIAGKANTNDFPSFSSKNSQPTAANMTPSSPRNLAGVQRHPSYPQEPRITPQVSPNTSQENFYNVPPVQPPNQFPPPPYFPIPFPPPPIAPSNASNAHSARVRYFSCTHPNDKCCSARKLEHHSDHECTGESNDAICGCLATNHTDGSQCAGTGKQECKNGQAI